MKQKNHDNSEYLVVSGIHSVAAVLSEQFGLVLKLWISKTHTNSRIDEIVALATQQSIAIEAVKSHKLDAYANAHQGIIAWCKMPTIHNLSWLKSNVINMNNVLMLDRITDSHNFGACLRSAEAAGVDAVIFPKRNTSAINTGTTKSASGALFRLPLVQTNLIQALAVLNDIGFQVIGLSEHAEQSIYEAVENKTLLVAGSEQHGLSTQIATACSSVRAIPCCGSNASLNVSVAVAISLFEINRQKCKHA